MVTLRHIALLGVLMSASAAFGQSGLRLLDRGEPGLDPSFARGWLAPEYDRFGFAAYHWRDVYRFAAGPRMRWSYAFGERASLSMSLASPRDWDYEARPLSLFGRYSLSPEWAVSAESLSRDASGLLRLQDLRIGVQRRF